MKFVKNGIQDEWHFVVGGGAKDSNKFYYELEKQLAPQVKALGLKTGYKKVGNLLSKKQMHFAKYGGYMSLTCAEPFGADLNVSWYLYYSGANVSATDTGIRLFASDMLGHITGKTRDKIIGFGAVGKDAAEKATKAIFAERENMTSGQSGQLGNA